MVPTRNAVYDSKSRQSVQANSKVQQARWKAKQTEFLKWLQTTDYRVTTEFKFLTDQATFICKRCKTPRDNTPFSMWRRKVAPVCLTRQFDSKLPKEYKRVSEYALNKVELKHKCGLVKTYVPQTFIRNGSACDCERVKEWRTAESYPAEVASLRDGAFVVEQDYVNTKTPIWHRHVGGCGKRFKQSPGRFIGGNRCLKCEYNLPLWTKESINEAIAKKFGKTYSVVKARHSVRTKWKLLHKTCGNKFEINPEYLIHKAQTAIICPFCKTGISKFGSVRRQGIRFQLQGTEKLALEVILAKGIKASSLINERTKVPTMDYEYNGKKHTYYPDFFVSDRNIIVESKDINSFGLGNWFEELVFERNCEKAKAVISSGYRFRMLVFNKGKLVKLPNKWWTMSKAEVNACIRSFSTT